MTQKNTQIYLSDKQTGARYGVGRGCVWRWVREKKFPAPVRFSPGCVRWALDEIEKHEKSMKESRVRN